MVWLLQVGLLVKREKASKVSVVEHVTYNDDRVIRWSKWVEEGSAMRETKEESIK